jgi:hypothetical protein
VPLRDVLGAGDRRAHAGGNRRRQTRMLTYERTACSGRSGRQPARHRGRTTRWHRRGTSTARRRWPARARSRCLVPKRGHGLGLARDLFEAIRRARGNGNLRIAIPAVDEDLVIALTTRKTDDATPNLLVGDLVPGVAAIALESHRFHHLWASALTCAVSTLSSTRS